MNSKTGAVQKSASNDSFLTPQTHKTEQLKEVLEEVLKEPEGAPPTAEAVPQEDEEPQEHYQQEDPAEEQLNKFWIAISGYPLDRAVLVYRFFNDIGKIQSRGFTQTNVMYLKYRTTVDCQIALSYDGQKIGYGGDIRVSIKPENPMILQAFLGAIEDMDDAITVDSRPIMTKDGLMPATLEATCVIDIGAFNREQEPQQQQQGREQERQQGGKQEEQKEQQAGEQKQEQQEQGREQVKDQPSEPDEVKVETPVNVVPPPKKLGLMQWLKEKISAIFFFY